MGLINKNTITSLELLEQINFFRKVEEKNEQRHDTLLNVIRDEFEEEIGVQKILETHYIHEQNKQKYPMFVLTISQAKQVLVRESKFVRKAVIKKLEELENKIKVPTTFKDALKLALEQQEQLERQQLIIQEKSKTIKEKVEVIDKLTEDLDPIILRKFATDYVAKKAKETSKKHSEIWNDIYGFLGRTLRMDLKKKIEKHKKEQKELIAFNILYNKTNKLKADDRKFPCFYSDINKLSTVEYICKNLGKGGLLLEVMAKVFEVPTEDIIGRYKEYQDNGNEEENFLLEY
mgnify:FL=1